MFLHNSAWNFKQSLENTVSEIGLFVAFLKIEVQQIIR